MITAPQPTFSNTRTRYGLVARVLHWLLALLIFTAIGLALYTETLSQQTEEGRAALMQIFSLHKTIGVAAFFTCQHFVADTDVGEGAAHHHFMVAAPRAVGVEIVWLHTLFP